MVNLRKAAIRLQKANSYAEEVKNTKKRLRISPSTEQLSSQEWQEMLIILTRCIGNQSNPIVLIH